MTSEVLQNPYFVGLYCIYNLILTKHTFNYKIVKKYVLIFIIFLKGGGGACGKKIVERKCLDDF